MAALATPSSPSPSHHEATLSSSVSSDSSLTSSSPAAAGAAAAGAIQTRTIHPQVHYVFADDDPQASNLLSQLPKARTISLHLDPATGRISGVDSFIPEFQITNIRAIPVPSPNTPSSTLQASASSSSLSGGGGSSSNSNSGGGTTSATTSGVSAISPSPPASAQATATLLQGQSSSSSSSSIAHHNLASSTILGQTKAARGQLSTSTSAGSGGSGGISSSGSSGGVSGTAGTSSMSRQASLKEASSMTEPGPPPPPSSSSSSSSSSSVTSSQPVYRDWTLVIEGVETDPHPERGRPGYYYDMASGNELQFMEDSSHMAASRRGGGAGDSERGDDGATLTARHGSEGVDDDGHLMGGESPVSRPVVLTAIGFHTEQDHETQQMNLILNDDYLDDCDAILASFGARNKLLKKVLDFNASQASGGSVGYPTAATGASTAKPNAHSNAEQNV
ncbi:hypothetical protein DFQ27_006968 [Actinomortierella ambigua]|uniref:Uncharacterized protein n=1 Tax=Actinomortierella ambigua TaxID=1343610 RepID=A0A9P6UBW2_9FUNG|nr:hypothetical protein DFQ27_006968 [Actinomortierella ambigua]